MNKKILTEMLHSSMLTKWMLLFVMAPGTVSPVTVQQPPVLAAALGHDITMPCHLTLSEGEQLQAPQVLYWHYLEEDTQVQVWIPSEKYVGRVELWEKNKTSFNKSILLKGVQWTDSGRYLCKISVNTGTGRSFRRTGNETLLTVYDTMRFQLAADCDSLLRCEVNTTMNPAFVLSISHDGHKFQTGKTVDGVSHVTHSVSVSLRGKGKYECQLHMDKDLITESVFHYQPDVAPEAGDEGKTVLGKNITTTSGPCVTHCPEPWFLYGALLLVPCTFLLSISTTLLICRRRGDKMF